MKHMTLTVSPEESAKAGPSVRLVVTVPVILIRPLQLRLGSKDDPSQGCSRSPTGEK